MMSSHLRVSKAMLKKVNRKLNRQEKVLLCGNNRRTKRFEEFLDKARNARDKYYELTESYEVREVTFAEVYADMKQLIEQDEEFLDPYLEIAEMAHETGEYDLYQNMLWRAYMAGVRLVANKTGEYPKSLPWSWHENRHVIRALNNFALMQWEIGEARLALEIYRKLLASNLNDNIGARCSILALRLGYTPEYEAEFLPEKGPAYGLDAIKMNKWFMDNASSFKEEFAEFEKHLDDFE
jgi:tetratricopeptide (TPR) repeat protein